ncbi:MAG: VWA domain-containing protein [Methylomonas sp.]|jgi:mxaC protein|uniref:vWA domain-containing protein n=1 Tax=Methylomonas sp. TaxID=418 RepID=UPI0025FD81EA|nr:vWA domain-containing protein [Methylomonas sp.]MCK9607024.1 VWA domain-containing protein [Methylomonas sp.]
MNNLAFETPWALMGLILLLVPIFRSNMRATTYPWLDMLPNDPWSELLNLLIRLLSMAALAALFLGLSGIHLKEQQVERIGRGAHIVMLLDRSNSMDNSFAGRAPDSNEQSKADAARRLLSQFVDQRPQDLIGVATYSTSPLFVIPLTDNRAAIHAAIEATNAPALAYTNISKGLGMALSFFDHQPISGSRIILLVSDGAAVIDPDSEAALRVLFKQQQVRLYWLFLRTDNSPGILAEPEHPRDDNAQAMPELYLHRFFSSLKIPYHAYEAENPDAMQKAIADIDRLEKLPLHYRQAIPKQDLSGAFYGWASFFMLLLVGVKICEARTA